MKTRTMWITLVVAAVLVLMAGGAGALAGRAEPEVVVADKINYQGWLTDLGGTPLNGTYSMQFELYDADMGGTMLWASGLISAEVDHGRFSVDLDVDPSDFTGEARWLRINVDGEWLSPRQELLAVPYALSLRPGARIVGDIPHGWGVEVFQLSGLATGGAVRATSATGTAVHGYSTEGFGVAGYSQDSYAVYGYDGGSEQARGYGGYFHSDNGIGVYGFSNALTPYQNIYAPGVYGESTNGVGVYGVSNGGKPGLRGESAGIGVYGYTSGTDIDDYGVYGGADGSAYGVYGYQASTIGGLGVYGVNQGYGAAVSGMNADTGFGTWGYSSSYNGTGGGTGRTDRNYGLYTPDNLYSLNYHTTGAVMQIVQNGGDELLEMGDVVSIAGLDASPVEGMPPVIQVQRTSEANSTAVIGVVASTYPAEWLTDPAKIDPTGATGPDKAIPRAGPGPIAPGEYLLVVVQGPAQVKASAVSSAIQAGDLLSSAEQAGYAGRAAETSIEGVTIAEPGTVFGKALEALDDGQKLLYVYVTLQ
jgi:hypothetical protein